MDYRKLREPINKRHPYPLLCANNLEAKKLMKCTTCGRDNLTEKELEVHNKYFHTSCNVHQQPQRITSGICPECKATLWHEEGCVKCHSCGFTKC